MHWLAIETSSPQVSMALGKGDTLLREVRRTGNASMLVEPLLLELEVDFTLTQRCVVGQGPGSYNGLRVGYAFLKGLLVPAPIPVVQVPTPLTLARQAAETLGVGEAAFLILNNARREEWYAALIRIREKHPSLEWETVCSEKELTCRLPSRLDAVVSYDLQADKAAPLAQYRWLSLLPSASTAGLLAFHGSMPETARLADLEPHYVRAAVPAAKLGR